MTADSNRVTDREKLSADDTIVLSETYPMPESADPSASHPPETAILTDVAELLPVAFLVDLPYLLLTNLLPEQGAKSVVFGAFDTESKTNVVVKVSKKDRSAMEIGETAGWVNETTLLETLSDTGAVVPFYTGGISKLEYVDGTSLKVRYLVMAQQECSLATLMERGIPEHEKLSVFDRLLDQVSKLHEKRYAHRDLKPKNVLVKDGGRSLVLADLYSAGIIGMPADLTIEAGLWTLNYMAPEQLGAPLQRLGPEIDVYALGVTLHEMLTGRLPFERHVDTPKESLKNPVVVDESLPPYIRTIIQKACRTSPKERYATARNLQRALRAGMSATRAWD